MKELRFTLEEPAKRNFGAAKKNKRETGSDYEEKAAGFLQSCGYTILEKNYRIRTGEIDLIVRDRKYLVFCEVKYRADKRVDTALEAVDQKKQMKIINTARYYLMRHPSLENLLIRFDVIGINRYGHIEYIQNAFEE